MQTAAHVTNPGPAPRRGMAIVACMDCRLMVEDLFDLAPGDAHVIRNAGGLVTDDVIRSLAVSQLRLGTREIVVVRHTDCGMHALDEGELLRQIEQESGTTPGWTPGSFADLEEGVRDALRELASSPYLTRTERLRGLVYDVHSGRVTEVAERALTRVV